MNIMFLELFRDTDEPRLPGDLSRAERMSPVDVLVRGGPSAADRARKTGSVVSGASSVRSLDVVKRMGKRHTYARITYARAHIHTHTQTQIHTHTHAYRRDRDI